MGKEVMCPLMPRRFVLSSLQGSFTDTVEGVIKLQGIYDRWRHVILV